ncbi:MAG: hypothetical protein IMZ67_07455 [Acidobacteria bacterium]|nr:hypothetical protein [Acidobacteriota bacterium]
MLLVVAAVRPARACSCIAQAPAQYFKGAELVLLGRAGKVATSGRKEVQPFEVIQVLKGKLGSGYRHQRVASSIPPCERTFTAGEVAVVFVSKGGLGICAGNCALEAQLPNLEQYLRLGAEKVAQPGLAALGVALAAIQGYLHDRPDIPVCHAPLAGKSLQLGKSTLTFVAAAKTGAIEITRALERGRVTLISGRYATEGCHFDVLLETGAKGFEVINLWGRETK